MYKSELKYYKKAFFTAMIMGVILLLPFVIIDGGYFIYYVYCLKTNDEGERRRNMQNIKITLIAMILITCGLAVIDAILGFYK